MRNTQTAMYLLGAIVVAAIIGIASYFLLISPELSKAATARDDTAIAQQNNALLEQKIAAMQVKEKEVPKWRDQIALISLDLPARPNESEIQRVVLAELASRKLPVVGITYGRAALIEPPAPTATSAPAPSAAPVAGTPTPAASATPSASAGPTTTTTTGSQPAAATFSGLVGIPVTVTTEGDPTSILAFLQFMQSQNQRFFTVTNFDITSATKTAAQPGRPALTEGQWIVNVTGLVFSLIDPTASFPPDQPGPVPPPTGAVPNPFIPLVPAK